MNWEVETQFLLFGLLLHTQPLNSSEQHKIADLEFSSDFDKNNGKSLHCIVFPLFYFSQLSIDIEV